MTLSRPLRAPVKKRYTPYELGERVYYDVEDRPYSPGISDPMQYPGTVVHVDPGVVRVLYDMNEITGMDSVGHTLGETLRSPHLHILHRHFEESSNPHDLDPIE